MFFASASALVAVGALAWARRRSKRRRGLFVGRRVEARYRGRARYYPGVLSRENGDGSWAVAYDDGDAEGAVPAALIATARRRASSRRATRSRGRIEGGPRYYPGEVVADNDDRSYECGTTTATGSARRASCARALRARAAAAPPAARAPTRARAARDCVRRSRERGSGGGAGGDALGACEGLGTFELDARTAATLRGVFDAIVAAAGARRRRAVERQRGDRRTKCDGFPAGRRE